mgnify:CR=1 FL=1
MVQCPVIESCVSSGLRPHPLKPQYGQFQTPRPGLPPPAHNGDRVTRDALYYHYAQLMRLADITDWKERNLTYYSTRHYGITKRLQSSANPLTLSKVCGTSLKHLTETYYHVDLREQEQAAISYFETSSEVAELEDILE